jgi:hypothetical protein
MMEFNPDGSIKLPDNMTKKKEENKEKLKKQRCICIKRKVVNYSAPKKCVLEITLSDALPNNIFISTIYNYFKEKAEVPHKLTKINEKQFEIEIGTDFRRCSDCNHLISEYRQFFEGNIIEEKGSCTFKGRNFSYEDYF